MERPKQNVIGTKWVFRNKEDEYGMVIRNKARLVVKGFTQIKGLDFGETYAPVARLESIHILLAFAAHHDFKLFQMDVKSAFLNGPLSGTVWSNRRVLKIHIIPTTSTSLTRHSMGLNKPLELGMIVSRISYSNKGLRLEKLIPLYLLSKSIMIFFYMPNICRDIIFGSTNVDFSEQFNRIMTKRFEMSIMGELTYFLGFQIKQLKDGVFISQTKYTTDMLKKFDIDKAKPIKTPMPTTGYLNLDGDDKAIDQKVYHSMIESLPYLCASRSDIMLSMCVYLNRQKPL